MSDFAVNESQQRLMRCIRALAQADVEGLSPAQVAKAVESTPSRVHHDLRNLQAAGFAQRIEATGRWALGAAIVTIAIDEHARVQRIAAQAEAIKMRYRT